MCFHSKYFYYLCKVLESETNQQLNNMKKTLFFLSAIIVIALSSCQPKNPAEDKQDDKTVVEAPVKFEYPEVTTTSIKVSIKLSDSEKEFRYMIGAEGELEQFTAMMGGLEGVIDAWGGDGKGQETVTFNDLIPNTKYVMYVMFDEKIYTDTTGTLSVGGTGEAVVSVDVTEIGDTFCTTTCTPNAEVAVYKYFIINADTADKYGDQYVIETLQEDPYDFYEEDIWQWVSLDPETNYYLVAIGKNINNEWGNLAKKSFTTLPRQTK